MSTATKSPTEFTAWMRFRIAVILNDAAKARRAYPDVVVVVPLARKWAEPGSVEDRSCDRCHTHVPDGDDLMLVHLLPAPWLHVCGGLCRSCYRLEVPR